MWAVDGGHVTPSQWQRAMMRDARRLVGVSHVNICPVVAACFDGHVVNGDPVWLVYNASESCVYLKTLLDQSRRQRNVRGCLIGRIHGAIVAPTGCGDDRPVYTPYFSFKFSVHGVKLKCGVKTEKGEVQTLP